VNPASENPTSSQVLSTAPHAEPASVGRPPQSVLVAEDSKVIRTKLVSILETLEGVELRVAGDGLEALALARERKPDLLLTDNEMPGLTGIQLVRVLRNTWSRLELPILMLTANSATETKVQAFRHGANDYVTKPVEAAELRARVRGQLDLKLAVQDNLEARLQLLEARKFQAVGRLAAGMAHELNNPAQFTASNLAYLAKSFSKVRGILQSTLDWAHAEQSRLPFAAQMAENCKRIALEDILRETPLAVDEALEGIRRMAHVIGELKEFAGEPGAELAELELNQALCNVVEVSRSTWSPSVELFLELHPKPLLVRAAAHPIKQAILNLLNNAVEAVASLGRTGNVVIASAPTQGGVEISISDDGPGIAPELQQHLFEPFFTTKPLGQGMGQGLFVAHAIVVEQHRGRLWCESRPGQGAIFRIWLPRAALPGAVSNEPVPSFA
jgi:two-component system, NtrC family, sensor kinase